MTWPHSEWWASRFLRDPPSWSCGYRWGPGPSWAGREEGSRDAFVVQEESPRLLLNPLAGGCPGYKWGGVCRYVCVSVWMCACVCRCLHACVHMAVCFGMSVIWVHGACTSVCVMSIRVHPHVYCACVCRYVCVCHSVCAHMCVHWCKCVRALSFLCVCVHAFRGSGVVYVQSMYAWIRVCMCTHVCAHCTSCAHILCVFTARACACVWFHMCVRVCTCVLSARVYWGGGVYVCVCRCVYSSGLKTGRKWGSWGALDVRLGFWLTWLCLLLPSHSRASNFSHDFAGKKLRDRKNPNCWMFSSEQQT